MGMYNNLYATSDCPYCGKTGDFEIQFKHGDTWLYAYRIGDEIKWGKNDYFNGEHVSPPIGDYKKHINERMIVEGIAGECSFCNQDYLLFDINIENNFIKSVKGKTQPEDLH